MPMEGIEIFDYRVGCNEDIVYLKIVGYIDTTTSVALVSQLRKLLQENYCQFVVDLGAVQYVSSAGWGVFVGEIKNVRDRGGDIKMVHMTPEVLDVFEMLEFNRILRTYDSVEEAINEFDFIRGFDITQSPIKTFPQTPKSEQELPQITPTQPVVGLSESSLYKKSRGSYYQSDPKLLPLSEKIKHIVIENPLLGVWGIYKEVRSEKYGKTKVGLIRFYRMLKELNLESKEKRYRFYRSR
ncbi:hypothetical protein DRQ11_00530 [candidate division KSB1 bacterium]|nr:MAG: hypothetical protein DRQ11_00530 [candidate division KSB1 bacterium]